MDLQAETRLTPARRLHTRLSPIQQPEPDSLRHLTRRSHVPDQRRTVGRLSRHTACSFAELPRIHCLKLIESTAEQCLTSLDTARAATGPVPAGRRSRRCLTADGALRLSRHLCTGAGPKTVSVHELRLLDETRHVPRHRTDRARSGSSESEPCLAGARSRARSAEI